MTNRYVEVNMDENNELIRMTCPVCKYPMRVLAKHENNVYQCYCAACQTDRYMKDTLDAEKLTFKEFDRCMKRGKGIDLERISDLVYELYNENKQLQFKLKECHDKKLFSRRELEKETERIKHIIQEAYETERTAIGKNVLKQLLDNLR